MKMAESLKIRHEAVERVRVKASARAQVPFTRRRSTTDKLRTNTADDQAIPRFENLVDLGMLAKVTSDPASIEDAYASIRERLEWQYVVTSSLTAWVEAGGEEWTFGQEFLWKHFARCFASAFLNQAKVLDVEHDQLAILCVMMEGYERVRRPFGHTPFESIAKVAMMRALQSGIVCEMWQMYTLVLAFKKGNLFSDQLKFAAGNDLNRMFVEVRPGFMAEAERHLMQSHRSHDESRKSSGTANASFLTQRLSIDWLLSFVLEGPLQADQQ